MIINLILVPKSSSDVISAKWPYGVDKKRVVGKYVIHNPTACGTGYIPVPILY